MEVYHVYTGGVVQVITHIHLSVIILLSDIGEHTDIDIDISNYVTLEQDHLFNVC
jgi:hypothetical protein